MKIARELRRILLVTGLILILLGVASLMRGAGPSGAALDSDTRFAGGVLVGFGVLWLYAARAAHLPVTLVRILAAGLLLGGLARAVSLLTTRHLDTLAVVQTVIEILIPTIVLVLLPQVTGDADETTT